MKSLLLSICLLIPVAAVGAEGGWRVIRVPGAWEESEVQETKAYDGFAWYRTWVWPHDEFFAAHERNLFEESVSLTLPGVADAHEAFVNGVRVGAGGKFPPEFQSGRAGVQRHKVPAGTLKKGEWNEITVRVFNASGPGGFMGDAPFIMDYFQECVLAGAWEFRIGDDPLRAGKSRKDKPATSAFDQYRESNRLLGESPRPVTGPKLEPEESARRMTTHPEFTVELLLSEPLIAQPVHLSFDARGRLWVSQYRQYPYPAGVRPVSRDKYYRTHYDAIPPAPPNHTKGRDRISVHEDTDGDGRYDKHLVFQDGLNLANAAVTGRGGVWVMHTPHLLFYPDKNGDALPDGPPEVKLTGFGLEDSHSVSNGLVWGMDGWLYGAQGSTCSCRVTRPGIDPPNAPGAAFEGCMVWRYHPGSQTFEIFAEGSGNTFGLEFDSEGRLFSGHNGGETRGWHYLQGGFYLKQGKDPGKFGPARHPWTFGDLPMMHSTTPAARFTHFFAAGEGTALPSSFHGRLFALDPLHNVVIAAERKPAGSTFATADLGPAVQSSDAAFRPVYIVNAPDGSLMVADFYDHYIAHGQHYQSQIDATTGRLFRLRGKDAKLEQDVNLSAKTGPELVQLLNHPNKWHRQTAVRLLGERRDPATEPMLRTLLAGDSGLASAGALWAMHQAGRLSEADLTNALKHPQSTVRLWAVRFIGDRYGRHPGIGLECVVDLAAPAARAAFVGAALEALAVNETNAEVRAQLACTARRLPPALALRVIAALAIRDEDAADPMIPHLLWYALEHHLAGNEKAVLGILSDSALWSRPLVATHLLSRLMRRMVSDDRQSSLLAAAALLRLAPDNERAKPLLAGFEKAVEGRDLSGLPEVLTAALGARGGMSLPLRLRNGEPAAVNEAIALLGDQKSRSDDRMLAIRTLGELRISAAVPALLDLAANQATGPGLRRAALASLASFDDSRIAPRLFELLPAAPADVQAAAYASLTSRASWTMTLFAALEAGALPISSVPAEIIETLRHHADKSIAAGAGMLFPATGAAGWQKRIAEVEAALKVPGGNPYEGEVIFTQRCAGCHKLFFKGGVTGPDLTSYQRDNHGTMLISIVNPNAEIREGYACQIIETTSGQTLSGYVLERDPNVLRLRTLDGQTATLAATEIKSLAPLGRSLMPEGLLDGLTDEQLRDLFAWLRQSQPITK